jgi:hypothetical protein
MATYKANAGTLAAVTTGKTSSVGQYSSTTATHTYLYEGTTAANFKLYRKVNHFGDTGYYNLVSPTHGDIAVCTPSSGSKIVYTYSEGAKAWAAATTSDVEGRAVKYIAAATTSSYVAGTYNGKAVIVKSVTTAPTNPEPKYVFDTTNLKLYRLIAATVENTSTKDYSHYYEEFKPSVNTVIAVGSGTTATSYIYKKGAGSWA